MNATQEQGLMAADQERITAERLKKRKKPGMVYYLIGTFLFIMAFFSLVLYFVLDRRIDILKQKELTAATEELQNLPQPTAPSVKVNEGNKFYYIWKNELFQYDIDKNENMLISGQVEGFEDITGLVETGDYLFLKDQNIIVSYSGINSTGVYLFDLTSSRIISKIEVPGGGDAFAFDSKTKILYQYIFNDGVYSFNIETNERAKLIDVRGERSFAQPQREDDLDLRLSPGGERLIFQDSKSLGSLSQSGESEEFISTRIIDIKNRNVIDAFYGTFTRWLDNDRVVYYAYKESKPVIRIRNVNSKTDVDVLKSLDNVIHIDVNTSTSEILVSREKINAGSVEVENHLYDNSVGIESRLDTKFMFPSFYKNTYIVGHVPVMCSESGETCSPETDFHFIKGDLAIYNIKAKRQNIIVKD